MTFVLAALLSVGDSSPTSSEMDRYRKEIIIVALDEAFVKKYGGFYESGKHLRQIGIAIRTVLGPANPKTIGLDISMFKPEGGDALEKSRIEFVKEVDTYRDIVMYGRLADDEAELLRQLTKVNAESGSCLFRGPPEDAQRTGEPNTYFLPAHTLLSSFPFLIASKAYPKISLNHEKLSSICFDYPRESEFETIPLQSLEKLSSSEARRLFDGKIVLIGVDLPDIDELTRKDGIKTNGVYILAEAVTHLLAQASKLPN